jgi:hypothetical protein
LKTATMDYVNAAVETLIENIKLRRNAKRQKCPVKIPDRFYGNLESIIYGLKRIFFFVISINSPLETN